MFHRWITHDRPNVVSRDLAWELTHHIPPFEGPVSWPLVLKPYEDAVRCAEYCLLDIGLSFAEAIDRHAVRKEDLIPP